MRSLISITLLIAAACSCALGEQTTLSGYVTAINSSSAFELNGIAVEVMAATVFSMKQQDVTHQLSNPPSLYLGEFLEVTGEATHKAGGLAAVRIEIVAPVLTRAEGTGIIDYIPAEMDPAGKIVRADGYLLLVPSTLHASFTAPLHDVSDVRTNHWVRYSGKQRADGVVVLDRAEFSVNTVNRREDHLRAKQDYDPAVIDQGDAQSGTSKFFRGKDPERLPAWHDDAMQARVERIGNKLVPAFQRSLPADDPTRIDFRFQVTDERKHEDAWSLSSGIILIPHQVVERLPDDSQLGAILADSIAEVLEKQDLRSIPARHKMTAASVAGSAAGIFVPGAALVPLVANHEVNRSMVRTSRQQSGRVSLCLMHDAGYDIDQAPKAWWVLHAKEGKELTPSNMPDHTLFLYEDLGTLWHIAPQDAAQTQ